MRVLSLFDGISCGQLALQSAHIPYRQYFASEIDKQAIKVTQTNFPNTMQVGDVCQYQMRGLWPDLLLAGSPCTNLSRSGDGTGLDGDQSRLFWEFVKLWLLCPGIPYIFENVPMKLSDQDIISECLGREPIVINSSLFSAQNRPRLYWTNIPVKPPPESNSTVTKDILEGNVGEKYWLSQKAIAYMNREFDGQRRWNKYPSHIMGKSQTIVANFFKGVPYGVVVTDPNLSDWVYSRGYQGESNTYIRRYTPIECERLQNLPDNYTASVANTHRYKAIGNGWTVGVIAHILEGLK